MIPPAQTTPVQEQSSAAAKITETNPSIRLVVCLGNPGQEYEHTRHNAGFDVAEELMKLTSPRKCSWQPDNGVLYEAESPAGHPFFLLLPMTFMNASGDCVAPTAGKLGISPAELLVVCDCLDLPDCQLRMRPSGASGGQRGLRSILANLGTEAVPRLRVGIGRPQDETTSIIDYVLGRRPSVDEADASDALRKAARMALAAIDKGVRLVMNECNRPTDKNNAEKQGELR